MSSPSHRAEEIVDAALDLPAEERAAFLAQTCADDVALRQLVEALLQAHQRAPAPHPEASASRHDEAASSSATISEKPGDRIGRYKLLQQVGEGGCGVVYMAEQEEPVRRRVALKVIKLGMDTEQVIARFEAERQTLALMDHPNIAKVLDAGATDMGRPYFVMELVRDLKITDYCDQNDLSTEQRLNLFIQVCRAVQHAHQKGIIHRDIKPSNILVTLHDGVPVPKVIDFGIAKATEQRQTDGTLFTTLEQFVGTPAYMSPEQAQMGGLDIDTRSDLYSLGVLLYELLTGQMPFDPKELRAAGLEQMRRIVREESPVKPSTRLGGLTPAEQTSLAKRRQVEASKLIHLLRGDLDWIVMKCLEKDRTRRYETTNGLASDLQRHLDNQPVVARPPTALYQFQKLVVRHKVVFVAVGTVAAALIIGLGLSIWLLARERLAEQRAQADRIAAQTQAAKSQRMAGLFEEMLRIYAPIEALGRDTGPPREHLDKAAALIGAALRDDPELEATFRDTLGITYYKQPDYSKAEDMFRTSLMLFRRVKGETNAQVAISLNNLGEALRARGDLDGAETNHRQALAIRQQLFSETNAVVAESWSNLAGVLEQRGDLEPAREIFQRVLEIRRGPSGNKDLSVAKALKDLSEVLRKLGDFAEAEAMHSKALDMYSQLVGKGSQ